MILSKKEGAASESEASELPSNIFKDCRWMRISFWCSMIHLPKNSQINNELKTARLLCCAIFSPAKQQHILDLQMQSFFMNSNTPRHWWIFLNNLISPESFNLQLKLSKNQKNSAFLMWLPLIGLLRLEKIWVQTLRSAFCNRHGLTLVMFDLSRQNLSDKSAAIENSEFQCSFQSLWFDSYVFYLCMIMFWWKCFAGNLKVSMHACQSTPNR